MSNFKMDDYVPVAERVDAFKTAFPDGSLQSEIVELTAGRVTVRAMAYRTPDDPRPGIGHSSLEIPGSTSFTRGSEIENAETSAWGRAIAALGFEVKRGLASAEEVRNKQPERRGGSPSSPNGARVQNQYRRAELAALMKDHNLTVAGVESIADMLNITERPMSDESMDLLIAAIQQPGSASVHAAPADTPEAGSSVPASGSTPDHDGSGMAVDPATTQAPEDEADPPGTSSGPAPAPSLDDVLAVSGGEVIPPKPGTPEYKALPSGAERAKARAYWDARKGEPEQETLAAALGAPEADR